MTATKHLFRARKLASLAEAETYLAQGARWWRRRRLLRQAHVHYAGAHAHAAIAWASALEPDPMGVDVPLHDLPTYADTTKAPARPEKAAEANADQHTRKD